MKASPPTSIASLLSPIPKEGVNMLLPSPSTLLFERSMGSLLSNFKGSVSDDQDMSSFFPAPMPSIVEEEDESMTASPFMSSSNMAKMSTPTLSTVSVSPAESASTPQLKNIISELDTNNASSSPFSREMVKYNSFGPR